MTLTARLRHLLLGKEGLPQIFDLPLHAPQTEVTIWLHGMGQPRDVSACHTVACGAPFTFCISFESGELAPRDKHLTLKFRESAGQQRLLGEIGLQFASVLLGTTRHLCLFRTISCTNHCIPIGRQTVQALYAAYQLRKNKAVKAVPVTAQDERCNAVTFICPRPVSLLSLFDGKCGTIVPINLFGTLGADYLGFALNSSNQTAPLANRLGRLALSSIPFHYADLVRSLGSNHRHSSIDWEQLPFPTKPSSTFKIPVPHFALRVRELQVQHAQPIGSHTFFLTRLISEQIYPGEPEFHRIHGLYAAYRSGPVQP